MKLLLGSNSPRRNQLLAAMGYTFTKVSIQCDEDFDDAMKVEEVAGFLAEKKSMAYAELGDNELLITADTVVIAEGKILNKPVDKQEAVSMLKQLSGGTHSVVTGLCLRTKERKLVFQERTEVEVDDVNEAAIEHYISSCEVYDKAGSYGIQDWFGLTHISGVNGCFYNVVGLPGNSLYKRLKAEFGVLPV